MSQGFDGGTVLVTGGAGFIGSEVVRTLIRNTDLKVVNLDKLTYSGNPESLEAESGDPRYVFARGDIADPALVRGLLEEHRPAAILHLAAESHVDRSIDRPADFITTNVVGTFALLSEAAAYWTALGEADQERFRFLHVSTDEVYGSLGDEGAFTEESSYDPSSPYSASKAAADHLARAWFRTYGFPVIVTSCSNNYGPFQFPEKLIPLSILNALEYKELPVYGRGENVRDWIHVTDHVQGLLRVLEAGVPGETYLIGGRNERRNRDVVHSIAQLVDELAGSGPQPRTALIRYVTDRPGHDHRYAIDPRKMERDLGWSPKLRFEDGLRMTVQWYLDNERWWKRVRSGVYRGERLGLEGAR